MFQFTGLPSLPYVFRQGHARITARRFPHSEIPGSKDGQLLTRAYRSRPRPSSAPGAKASTVCPLSLDHEERRVCRYGVFKVRAGDPAREAPAQGRSLKTQQRVVIVEVDVVSRRARAPDGKSRQSQDESWRRRDDPSNGPGACGSWSSRVP